MFILFNSNNSFLFIIQQKNCYKCYITQFIIYFYIVHIIFNLQLKDITNFLHYFYLELIGLFYLNCILKIVYFPLYVGLCHFLGEIITVFLYVVNTYEPPITRYRYYGMDPDSHLIVINCGDIGQTYINAAALIHLSVFL